jgi:transglutaminase-like putative cysteine protease
MIGWLVGRLLPREGWGTFFLLLATVLCLPASAIAAEWVPGGEGWLPLAFVALLVGRWLASREDWGWDVWLPVGASLGLLASLSVAAHVVLFLPGSGEAAFGFARRWVVWLDAAFSGGASDDPDIFLFYTGFLCWGAVLLAAWAFYRRQRPLLALLLPAMLSALTVFYSGKGILWLAGELGCGVLLLAVGNLTHAQRKWDATGVDYATGLELETVSVGIAITIPVVLLSLLVPYFSVRDISDWFWRTFAEPSARVDETAERLFGGVSPPEGGPPGGEGRGAGASSYLPRTHLLGGHPGLLDDVVMMVWTDEPPPLPPEGISYEVEVSDVPRHYWLGGTFDYYSGRGWATTVGSHEEVEGELPLPAPPDYREVEQRFKFTAPHGDTLYALNAPAWTGGPVEAVWHGPGDLARLASEVVSYTVVSRLPTPTAADLRAIPPLYSPEVLERYLQLPETVPQRVIDLAWDVVAEGETVYERARLLERYLRAYPYSVEVEQPPEDEDVADYFLFEVREGYCDYYATAFVVMARAVGIPARLASGYVGGQYDFTSRSYLVRQFNGHSWPEVYFPGWGWIGFEPTGSQQMTELPEEVPLPEEALPRPTGPPARVVRSRQRAVGLVLVALVGLGAAATVWLRERRRRAARRVTPPLVWGCGGGGGGARLGLPPDPALTPQEYAAALAAELHARAGWTRRWRARRTELAAQGGAALEVLATLYSAQVYGGRATTAAGEEVVRQVWARLRGPLRWFLIHPRTVTRLPDS